MWGFFLWGVKILISRVFSLDPYARKDWYDVKAPAVFAQRAICKTIVTRTTGTSA
jgi:small subunit ribosomal protein S3Ae